MTHDMFDLPVRLLFAFRLTFSFYVRHLVIGSVRWRETISERLLLESGRL